MTGAMFWIGTESIELQEGTPPPKNCYPTIRLDTSTHVFTPDIGLYALAIPFRAAQPNRSVISTTNTLTFTQPPVAFYDPVQGGFGIAGHTNQAVTIVGELNNLPVVSRLQLYETDGSGNQNAARQADVAMSGQVFSVTIPADTLFELEGSGSAPPPPPAPSCPPMPETCRTALRSSLLLRNASDDTQDKLAWTWNKGTSTALTEFGDPRSTTDYTICLYEGPTSALVGQATILANSIRWRATGTRGYRYADPAGAAGSITKVVLKESTDNAARLTVNGRGAGLPDLLLPTTAPVTIQLLRDGNGPCWGSSFTTSQLRVNDAEMAKARAP
jgi:hypothetical protein